jgi:hypothetical protein
MTDILDYGTGNERKPRITDLHEAWEPQPFAKVVNITTRTWQPFCDTVKSLEVRRAYSAAERCRDLL